MPNPPGAGELADRVKLQRRSPTDDGYGNSVIGGQFETVHIVSARLMPLRGGEAVQSARLEGRQPYLLTVRQSSQTRTMDETWRVEDARRPGRVFSIVSPPSDPYGTRAFFDMIVIEGGRS